MKKEWLVVDVTSVVTPDRAKRGILEMILVLFWPIQARFVLGEPLCDVGLPC